MARNDRWFFPDKIISSPLGREFIAECGYESLGILVALLQVLFHDCEGKHLLSLSKGLAFTLRIDHEKLLTLIEQCISYKLLITDGESFWNQEVLDDYLELKSKQLTYAANRLGKGKNQKTIDEQPDINSLATEYQSINNQLSIDNQLPRNKELGSKEFLDLKNNCQAEKLRIEPEIVDWSGKTCYEGMVWLDDFELDHVKMAYIRKGLTAEHVENDAIPKLARWYLSKPERVKKGFDSHDLRDFILNEILELHAKILNLETSKVRLENAKNQPNYAKNSYGADVDRAWEIALKASSSPEFPDEKLFIGLPEKNRKLISNKWLRLIGRCDHSKLKDLQKEFAVYFKKSIEAPESRSNGSGAPQIVKNLVTDLTRTVRNRSH